jgi:DNA-binding transcriptional regulator YiaG
MVDVSPTAIRIARQRLGLTQVQLAERIGCTPIAVSYWERGTRTPTGLYARAVQAILAEAETAPEAREVETIMPPPPSG